MSGDLRYTSDTPCDDERYHPAKTLRSKSGRQLLSVPMMCNYVGGCRLKGQRMLHRATRTVEAIREHERFHFPTGNVVPRLLTAALPPDVNINYKKVGRRRGGFVLVYKSAPHGRKGSLGATNPWSALGNVQGWGKEQLRSITHPWTKTDADLVKWVFEILMRPTEPGRNHSAVGFRSTNPQQRDCPHCGLVYLHSGRPHYLCDYCGCATKAKYEDTGMVLKHNETLEDAARFLGLEVEEIVNLGGGVEMAKVADLSNTTIPHPQSLPSPTPARYTSPQSAGATRWPERRPAT